MRHKALPHGGGDARQPRRRGRQRARSGRQARRGRCRSREGERAYGPTEGRSLTRRLTERRSLRSPRRAECAFPSHHRPGDAGPNRPPACGALWKMAQLGKCARATPRQAAGGVAPETRRPWAGARPHGKAQSVFWFNKNCAVPIWEQDGLPCTIHLHDVVAISSRHTKTGMQANSGRGAWLRPKPRPRERVAAAMPPVAQQKTQRGDHGDGAIGVRVTSSAFGMRPLGERSVRARNDFVAVGELDLRFVGEDDGRRLRNAFRMALRLEHGVAVPDPCLLNERVAVLPGEKCHVQVQRCFRFRSRP